MYSSQQIRELFPFDLNWYWILWWNRFTLFVACISETKPKTRLIIWNAQPTDNPLIGLGEHEFRPPLAWKHFSLREHKECWENVQLETSVHVVSMCFYLLLLFFDQMILIFGIFEDVLLETYIYTYRFYILNARFEV